jgi:hypothetical protein
MEGWIPAYAIGHLANAPVGIPTEIEGTYWGAGQMPRMVGLSAPWQGCVHLRLLMMLYVHETELYTQDWVVHARLFNLNVKKVL